VAGGKWSVVIGMAALPPDRLGLAKAPKAVFGRGETVGGGHAFLKGMRDDSRLIPPIMDIRRIQYPEPSDRLCWIKRPPAEVVVGYPT
jgi:hypothetical protein